ncbi:MAG: hypothetical protein EXQ53_03090 [Acidobacteria bacterium]|nr:hypothetical protein [Acidobacteriota bacterium]
MTTQTYENHRYRPLMWMVTALSALASVVLMVLFVLRQPSLISGGLLLIGFVVVGTVVMVRLFALRLQNRIIRLEMQVRLARLGREGALARLTLRQVVALRFASDAELPALLDRAVAENLTDDQIKRAVTAWQADDMRT